jgi:hypothetical protein
MNTIFQHVKINTMLQRVLLMNSVKISTMLQHGELDEPKETSRLKPAFKKTELIAK